MALWVCGGESGCGTKYAVGLFRCPRCHSTKFHEEGSMPKITRHGGPTDKTLPPTPPPNKQEGGERSSAGSSSSASPEKPQTSTETSKPAPQRRARTTGNRSKKAQTGSFSARSTGGGRMEPTSATESDERKQGDST